MHYPGRFLGNDSDSTLELPTAPKPAMLIASYTYEIPFAELQSGGGKGAVLPRKSPVYKVISFAPLALLQSFLHPAFQGAESI